MELSTTRVAPPWWMIFEGTPSIQHLRRAPVIFSAVTLHSRGRAQDKRPTTGDRGLWIVRALSAIAGHKTDRDATSRQAFSGEAACRSVGSRPLLSGG
ncbi:hypothetical protein KM043_012943 [Ampulex compressa]|nr:hypothetical protein KM043_012943 [Ampulex compressa]